MLQGVGTARVVVEITDTGPGIPPEQFPRLFQSFFTTKRGGMGIGLAMCRSIIEAHGGTIEAANLPDGGACFRFALPVVDGLGSVQAY
jgi:signal transduction histidine kinase